MNDAEFTQWSVQPGAVSPPIAGQGATLRQIQVPAGRVAARHSATFTAATVLIEVNLAEAAPDA